MRTPTLLAEDYRGLGWYSSLYYYPADDALQEYVEERETGYSFENQFQTLEDFIDDLWTNNEPVMMGWDAADEFEAEMEMKIMHAKLGV